MSKVKRFVTQTEKTQWRMMRRAGKTIREIAEHAGRHWNTIERHVSDHAETRQQRTECSRSRARRLAKAKAAGYEP